jgi:hypothetical protein
VAVTACVVCVPRPDEQPHDPAEGWLCCWRAYARMMGALRLIPELVVELHGLGFVQRDVRARLERDGSPATTVGESGRLVGLPADPVAHALPSGPLNGSKGSPRVNGSREAPVPIRIDPTDLLARSRPASLAVAITGSYAQDQIGHLAVATELEFWVTDWADIRHEGRPLPTVPRLAQWLLDRLEWACGHHPAIDEFAGKLRDIRNALTAAAGRFDAVPESLSAPCDSCGTLGLYRDTDLERIACGSCARLMTESEYADYTRWLIKENPS